MLINNVGVVIPFYQRASGILAKALLSIVAQQVENTAFTIVIVDDGSPVAADNELTTLELPEHCRIELIKQKNAGPAVARNTALDYLQECGISIVAFLDSDDVWKEQHISEALSALSDGAGFYFCNHSRFNKTGSWFNSLECFENWDETADVYDIKLSVDKQLAELTGANCFKLFIKDYLSQTSCIVYDFKSQPNARFDPSLVSAGEDFLLWLQLVNNCEKVVFSFNENTYCGEGVNIYFDSFDWSKLDSSTQVGFEFVLFKMILSTFFLQENEHNHIKRMAEYHLNLYSYLMIKHLISGKGFNLRLATIIFKKFPSSMFSVPFRFLMAVVNRDILKK
ncbi:glycosyltransferase family 2 protein [Pseudoalteromonas sp. EB27]|uniref:glycosyltransferase family 2 protein n=1 Tax=Pseudoalteromonas sp. EB27 TaxID=1938368 RepID=UPI00097752EF|nr:glycosyltransferase family 2 protein [Pseudoalteromonas sp. EB27]